MATQWALASDFLSECHDDLVLLRNGMNHRAMDRTEALELLQDADQAMARFRAALDHFLPLAPVEKAHQVGVRLLTTAEMLGLLLGWARNSIVYLFDDCDCPVPVG